MAINTKQKSQTTAKLNRRAFGKAAMAGVLGGPAALSSVAKAAEGQTPSDKRTQGGRSGMKLALMLRPEDKDRWVLARQIGVNHAIVSLSSVLDKITRDEYLDTLRQIKATYEESGLTIAGVESHPVAAEKIKLGVPGRDEEIANYCAVIEALGKVGIPMCCYNFKLMGDDIQSLVREFGKQDKIFFVHLRDVQGTRERFRETFHDNGPTDMAEMLRLYHEVGFLGPIRPYHAPTLADESNQRPGYAMQGKVFAIGYMKGIAEALNISVI